MVHGNLLHTGEISHRRNIERRATELEMKRQNMHLTIMDLKNEKKKLQKQAYSLRATLVCTQQVFANVVKELQEEKRRREEVAEEAEVAEVAEVAEEEEEEAEVASTLEMAHPDTTTTTTTTITSNKEVDGGSTENDHHSHSQQSQQSEQSEQSQQHASLLTPTSSPSQPTKNLKTPSLLALSLSSTTTPSMMRTTDEQQQEEQQEEQQTPPHPPSRARATSQPIAIPKNISTSNIYFQEVTTEKQAAGNGKEIIIPKKNFIQKNFQALYQGNQQNILSLPSTVPSAPVDMLLGTSYNATRDSRSSSPLLVSDKIFFG